MLGLGRLQAWLGDPTTRRSTSGPITDGATPTSTASAATPANWGYANSPLAECVGGPEGLQWMNLGFCRNPRLDLDSIDVAAARREKVGLETQFQEKEESLFKKMEDAKANVADEKGKVRAEGRWISGRRRVLVAESRLVDSEGEEIGRGTGTFMRSRIALSGLDGYAASLRTAGR